MSPKRCLLFFILCLSLSYSTAQATATRRFQKLSDRNVKKLEDLLDKSPAPLVIEKDGKKWVNQQLLASEFTTKGSRFNEFALNLFDQAQALRAGLKLPQNQEALKQSMGRTISEIHNGSERGKWFDGAYHAIPELAAEHTTHGCLSYLCSQGLTTGEGYVAELGRHKTHLDVVTQARKTKEGSAGTVAQSSVLPSIFSGFTQSFK